MNRPGVWVVTTTSSTAHLVLRIHQDDGKHWRIHTRCGRELAVAGVREVARGRPCTPCKERNRIAPPTRRRIDA